MSNALIKETKENFVEQANGFQLCTPMQLKLGKSFNEIRTKIGAETFRVTLSLQELEEPIIVIGAMNKLQ